MNRLFAMRRILRSALLIPLLSAACAHQASSSTECPTNPATTSSCRYVLSGGVTSPGPRDILPGDTVASVIARNLPDRPGKPITIVLVRRAPEGITRQLIQLDADGQLMDPKQNLALRNGDELVFPGGTSMAASNPTGTPHHMPGE